VVTIAGFAVAVTLQVAGVAVALMAVLPVVARGAFCSCR
jgi:hypothetical protein